jgi:hypothetical protein
LTDDIHWQRYAEQAGCQVDCAPFDFGGLLNAVGKVQTALVVNDKSHAPAQYRDAWGWREALKQLDEHWFAPALAGLKSRQLEELTVICHGEGGFRLVVRPGDLWKFWRGGKTLAQLY